MIPGQLHPEVASRRVQLEVGRCPDGRARRGLRGRRNSPLSASLRMTRRAPQSSTGGRPCHASWRMTRGSESQRQRCARPERPSDLGVEGVEQMAASLGPHVRASSCTQRSKERFGPKQVDAPGSAAAQVGPRRTQDGAQPLPRYKNDVALRLGRCISFIVRRPTANAAAAQGRTIETTARAPLKATRCRKPIGISQSDAPSTCM